MSLFKNIAEIKGYLPVNTAFHWEDIAPFIDRAQTKYLKPELGNGQLVQLEAAYEAGTMSQAQERLLHFARIPLANFAYLMYLPHGVVQISSAGIQTSSTANKKTAAEWMLDDLEASYKDAGYEGIDQMLEYLEENQLLFPAWKDSLAYTVLKEFFLSKAAEFSQYVNINNSRRTFLALRATMRKVENSLKRSVIGAGLFDELKQQLKDGLVSQLNGQLLELIRPAVAHLTMARAVVELSVTVGERGISVFTNSNSLTTGVQSPAESQVLLQLREDNQKDGDDYLKDLADFLTANVEQLPLYKNSNCYVADVTKTFENTQDSAVYAFL